MSAPLRIEAPTDAQIGFVARLCEERGFPTLMDDLAEAGSEAWFEERER